MGRAGWGEGPGKTEEPGRGAMLMVMMVVPPAFPQSRCGVCAVDGAADFFHILLAELVVEILDAPFCRMPLRGFGQSDILIGSSKMGSCSHVKALVRWVTAHAVHVLT